MTENVRNKDGIAVMRQVILTITGHCNLNCHYCYESYKECGRLMSLETAQRCLEKEFEKSSRDGVTVKLDISYMGGEPLENFKLIREISEWLWSRQWPLPYDLSFPTNGTLLNDEMRTWLVANRKKLSVGLSFDGLAGVNAINRTNLPIDYEFFLKNWPDRRIAVVLFRDSIGKLADNVREMNQKKIPFSAAFGDGFVWTEKDADLYEKQMTLLMDDYMDDPEEGKASGLFSMRLADFFPGNLLHTSDFCGAVDNIVNYDTDGEPYICHIFAPLTLGREKARKAREKYKNLKSVPWDPVCDQCPIRNTCKPCFGFHEKLFNDVQHWSSPHTICRMQKAKAKICSLLYLKRIQKKLEKNGELSGEELMSSEKALQYLNYLQKEEAQKS